MKFKLLADIPLSIKEKGYDFTALGVFLHERKELASRAVYVNDRKNNFSHVWRYAFSHSKTIKVECSNVCMDYKSLHRPRVTHHRGSHLVFPKVLIVAWGEGYNRWQRKHNRKKSLNLSWEDFSGIPALLQLSPEVLSRSSEFSFSHSCCKDKAPRRKF